MDAHQYRRMMLDLAYLPSFMLYVRPYYLSLLHGNFASGRFEEYGDEHSQRIARAARRISDARLKRFFKVYDWRPRLTAAWFVGLSQRSSFVEQIGELLLKDEHRFAGQGYCVAMGLIGGQTCQNYLRDYLKKYLPVHGGSYDRQWALGALAHIQGKPPQEFLDPTLRGLAATAQPLAGTREFGELVQYLQQHRMITSRPKPKTLFGFLRK